MTYLVRLNAFVRRVVEMRSDAVDKRIETWLKCYISCVEMRLRDAYILLCLENNRLVLADRAVSPSSLRDGMLVLVTYE
jgi:hypothetical protein